MFITVRCLKEETYTNLSNLSVTFKVLFFLEKAKNLGQDLNRVEFQGIFQILFYF